MAVADVGVLGVLSVLSDGVLGGLLGVVVVKGVSVGMLGFF